MNYIIHHKWFSYTTSEGNMVEIARDRVVAEHFVIKENVILFSNDVDGNAKPIAIYNVDSIVKIEIKTEEELKSEQDDFEKRLKQQSESELV